MIRQIRPLLQQFLPKQNVENLTTTYSIIEKLGYQLRESPKKELRYLNDLIKAYDRNLTLLRPDQREEWIKFFVNRVQAKKKFYTSGFIDKLFQVLSKYATCFSAQNPTYQNDKMFIQCVGEDAQNYSKMQCGGQDIQKFAFLFQITKEFINCISYNYAKSIFIKYFQGKHRFSRHLERWKDDRWILTCISALISSRNDTIFEVQIIRQIFKLQNISHPKVRYAAIQTMASLCCRYPSFVNSKEHMELTSFIFKIPKQSTQDKETAMDKIIRFLQIYINGKCLFANKCSISVLSDVMHILAVNKGKFTNIIQLCTLRMNQLADKYKNYTKKEEEKLLFNMYFDCIIKSIKNQHIHDNNLFDFLFGFYQNYHAFIENSITNLRAWKLFCECGKKSLNWRQHFETVVLDFNQLNPLQDEKQKKYYSTQHKLQWIDVMQTSIDFLGDQTFMMFEQLIRMMLQALQGLRGDSHKKGLRLLESIFEKTVPAHIQEEKFQKIRQIFRDLRSYVTSFQTKVPTGSRDKYYTMKLLFDSFVHLFDQETLEDHYNVLRNIFEECQQFADYMINQMNQMQQENEEEQEQEQEAENQMELCEIFGLIGSMLERVIDCSDGKQQLLQNQYNIAMNLLDQYNSSSYPKRQYIIYILNVIIHFRSTYGYGVLEYHNEKPCRSKQYCFAQKFVNTDHPQIKQAALKAMVLICNNTPPTQLSIFMGTRNYLIANGLQDRIIDQADKNADQDRMMQQE